MACSLETDCFILLSLIHPYLLEGCLGLSMLYLQ